MRAFIIFKRSNHACAHAYACAHNIVLGGQGQAHQDDMRLGLDTELGEDRLYAQQDGCLQIQKHCDQPSKGY